MKKLFTLLAVLAFFHLNAQITITESNLIDAGVIVVQRNDTLPAITVVPGGTGSQTWNFATLNNHYTTNLNFVLPSQTPYAAQYPASNLCAAVPASNYYYYLIKESTGLKVAGTSLMYSGQLVHLKMVPAQKLLTFPSTYQTSYNDTCKSSVQIPYVTALPTPPFPANTYTDSARSVSTYYKTSLIDAYGTITTPMGTYSSIRQKTVEVKKDSIYAHTPGYPWMFASTSAAVTTTKYTWWTNDINAKYPLLEMTVDSSNVATNVVYLIANPIQGISDNLVFENSVFPNPASDFVNFTLKNKSRITVFTNAGQLLETIKTDVNYYVLDVSKYSEGLYFYNVTDDKGYHNKGKFMVVK